MFACLTASRSISEEHLFICVVLYRIQTTFGKKCKRETAYYSIMVRSAGLCVFVCGISIGIKHCKTSGINPGGGGVGITMFYTNRNSADAKPRWTHHKIIVKTYTVQGIPNGICVNKL